MAEYTNVEKPFLEKLHQAHWDVINQGQGIPEDPKISRRTSFDEVALKTEFLSQLAVSTIGLHQSNWNIATIVFYCMAIKNYWRPIRKFTV